MKKRKAEETRPLISVFEQIVRKHLKPDGLYPYPILIRTRDGQSVLGSIDLPTPLQSMQQAARLYREQKGVEVAFAIDRESGKLKDEGLRMKDFVSIFHLKDGVWRMGLLYFHAKGSEGDVQWDNKFWIEQMTKEVTATGIGID